MFLCISIPEGSGGILWRQDGGKKSMQKKLDAEGIILSVFKQGDQCLTFEPLPKIDPKDKGKKVLYEEAEILAARLQEEERGKVLIEDEKHKCIHVLLLLQRRFLHNKEQLEIRKATGQKKDDSIKKESKEEESTGKRKLGTRKKIKSRKRRFRQDTSQDDQTDSEKENDELRLCLTIATDKDKEVDYEILNKKYPINKNGKLE
ncbi:hypothetical protein Tco_0403485 [Tanacetum coccineum]